MMSTKPEKRLEVLLDSITNANLDEIHKLIHQGVNVNGYEDAAKIRPLHIALQYHASDVIKVLIAAGADPHAETSDGMTPLDIARLHNNEDQYLAILREFQILS